jgi:hypothetical protein
VAQAVSARGPGLRRLYLDDAPGEARGVVTLDGLPERLLLARGDLEEALGPGAQARARIRRLDKGLGLAFLDLGEGLEAVAPLNGLGGASEGAAGLVEIAAAARRGKAAVARWLGPAEGPPGLAQASPGLLERLQAVAPGQAVARGPEAVEAADEAEAAALAAEHPLPGGGRITVEQTRALVAVDVDVGAGGRGDARVSTAAVNRQALAAAARVLRLKGLGGLVVIDLVGRGHDGEALSKAAGAAFAPDNPGVAIGRVSRFGLMELALPWRARPAVEILGEGGRPSVRTLALRLARALVRAAEPGRRAIGCCSPEVAAAFEPLAPLVAARIGPRFDVLADPSRPAEFVEAHAT